MQRTILQLVREAVSSVLRESYYTLDHNMVPAGIRAWVNATLGRNIRKYKLVQTGEVEIGMPVFEADREIYQMFRLENGNAVPMEGVNFYRAGNEGDGVPVTGHKIAGKATVPSGHVLVKTSRYIGDATLFTADDAQKLLPPAPAEGEELTDLELLALYQAKSLIASYRHKFKPEVYARLQQLGLMAANKSITTKGRNALEYPQNSERLGTQGNKLMPLIEPWRKNWAGGGAGDVSEGISPERRAEAVAFAKLLKKTLMTKYGIPKIRVEIGKSVSENPYITVSSHAYPEPLPEQLRRDCLLMVYGPEAAEKMTGMGNIREHYIALNWSVWQKLMQ